MPNYFRQFREFEEGEHIVVGADTSVGGTDYCAAQFLSKTHLDVPLVFHGRVIATEMTNALLPVLNAVADRTNIKPVVAYERNNGGVFELERLGSLNYSHKFQLFPTPIFGYQPVPDDKEPTKFGWDTNSATRPIMLGGLKDAIDHKLFRIYDQPTINELFSFVVVRTSSNYKAQAEEGAHDDLVMSLAVAWQVHLHAKTPVRLRENLQIRRKERMYDKVTGRLVSWDRAYPPLLYMP